MSENLGNIWWLARIVEVMKQGVNFVLLWISKREVV